MSNVKYSINKTKDEEPLVTNTPIINDPMYFKLLECGKRVLGVNHKCTTLLFKIFKREKK